MLLLLLLLLLLTRTFHRFSSTALLFWVRFTSIMKISEGVSRVLLNVDIALRHQQKNDRKRKDYLKGICFLEYDGHFLRVLGIYLLLFLKSRRSLSQFFFCNLALKDAQSLSHKHTTTNLILRLWKLFLNNFTRQLRIKKIHSERVQVQRSMFAYETWFWNFMFTRKHE